MLLKNILNSIVNLDKEDLTRAILLSRYVDQECLFSYPVDTEKYPDYLNYVATPMDLSTVEFKHKENKYININDYQKDFNLIIQNCFKYNPPTNFCHQLAIRLNSIVIIIIRLLLIPQVSAILDCLSKDLDERYEDFYNFVESYITVIEKAPKRSSRRSSINKIYSEKQFKPETINFYEFYWCKAKGINWYPALVIVFLNT